MTKILITGGAGFVGAHIVEELLENTDWEIVILDRFDFSGNPNRLTDMDIWEKEKRRVNLIWWDLKSEINPFIEKEIGQVDCVWHMAANSHVDRSIENPLSFVMDNVVGTVNLLNFARKQNNLRQFINFSTDEVFGPAPCGYANKETDAHRPSNPYAASKAAAADIGYSYFITYGLPIITTHTMNNFGERQNPEKLIPKCIRMTQQGKPMPIFAEWDENIKKMKSVGSRFWIHSREVAKALLFLSEKGKPGEFYNIIGFDELNNLEICEIVARAVGKPLIPDFVDFHSSRPGHDLRYALDGTKLKKMGWAPKMPIEESLTKVVKWTINHPKWL